jgi:hypothetical protein
MEWGETGRTIQEREKVREKGEPFRERTQTQRKMWCWNSENMGRRERSGWRGSVRNQREEESKGRRRQKERGYLEDRGDSKVNV